MRFSLHHIHRRKRHHEHLKKVPKHTRAKVADKKLQPYPHPNPWIARLDKLMYVLAIVGPLMNLPQLLRIYVENEVAGLAMSTWVMLFMLKIPWIAYSVVHKEFPMLITSVMWACSHLAVVIGILIYS